MTPTTRERTSVDGASARVRDENDVSYWTSKLNCTEEQLKTAIEVVGVVPKLAGLRDKLLRDTRPPEKPSKGAGCE